MHLLQTKRLPHQAPENNPAANFNRYTLSYDHSLLPQNPCYNSPLPCSDGIELVFLCFADSSDGARYGKGV